MIGIHYPNLLLQKRTPLITTQNQINNHCNFCLAVFCESLTEGESWMYRRKPLSFKIQVQIQMYVVLHLARVILLLCYIKPYHRIFLVYGVVFNSELNYFGLELYQINT